MIEHSPARVVIVESPYAGCVPLNRAYLQACLRDCAARNETPYASHQMLTDALNDRDPEQRALGMRLGIDMRNTLTTKAGAKSVFYGDLGESSGMKAAWESLVLQQIPDSVELRVLPAAEEVWARIWFEATRQESRLVEIATRLQYGAHSRSHTDWWAGLSRRAKVLQCLEIWKGNEAAGHL